MQESLAEMSVARVPLVVLNMARARRATTGRPPVAAATATTGCPCSRRWMCAEAVAAHAAGVPSRLAVAQPGAALRRLLPRAHHAVGCRRAGRLRPATRHRLGARRLHRGFRQRAIGVAARHRQAARHGRLRPRPALPLGRGGHHRDARRHRAAGRHRIRRRRRRGGRSRSARPAATCAPPCAASGPTARRSAGYGPISLVPFPSDAIAAAADGARAVAVYENNQGQMIDDVRLAVLGRCPVHFIGGLSLDSSGFGIAPDLEVGTLRARIEEVLD